MLKTNRKLIRGDTLIEVLFATAAFSLIAVSGLSIMNQGTSTAQRALEITLVRQEIDAQAETLRFLNSSYISAYQSRIASDSGTPAEQWELIQKSTVTSASSFDSGTACQKPPTNSFILNTHSAKVVTAAVKPPVTFSQVQYDYDAVTRTYTLSRAEGIWVEAVKFIPSGSDANQKNAGYIDFHIRACWDSPGQAMPVNIGTIVRLYEPRG